MIFWYVRIMSYNHDGGGEGVMSRRMRIDCGLGRQWLKSEAGDCMFSQEKQQNL